MRFASTGTRNRIAPRVAARLALVLAIASAPLAQSQVYKCTDSAGRTSYSDAPCARGARPLAIPNAATAPATGSWACVQLRDELDRLAAVEAGRKSPSQRRVALHKQYAARCIGISRVRPDAK